MRRLSLFFAPSPPVSVMQPVVRQLAGKNGPGALLGGINSRQHSRSRPSPARARSTMSSWAGYGSQCCLHGVGRPTKVEGGHVWWSNDILIRFSAEQGSNDTSQLVLTKTRGWMPHRSTAHIASHCSRCQHVCRGLPAQAERRLEHV